MKLTIIGGGSTYTPELVSGVLARHDRAPCDEIALVDPDLARLDILGSFVRRMVRGRGIDIDVTWGSDLALGVVDSDFVVSQIRVGGQQARERDEQLGRQFGLIGQETVGVGGLAKALRTIPVALAIDSIVANVAPRATVLNFTNPAGLVTEALARHGRAPTIGLCNVPWNFRAGIAAALDAPVADVSLTSVGLNHLSWITRVDVAGEDRTAAVVEGAIRRAEHAAAKGHRPDFAPELLKTFCSLPNPYVRYYTDPKRVLEEQAAKPTRASEVARIEAALLERYQDPGLDAPPPELAQRGGAHYSEAAAALIADLIQSDGANHVVNVTNGGAITDLDHDSVIEVACTLDGGCVTPVPVGATPPPMATLVHRVKEFERLTVRAAIEGDPDLAIAALHTNPLGPRSDDAPSVWHRLREVNRGMLGTLDD
jgi:6-phospho-beta-glucosidase